MSTILQTYSEELIDLGFIFLESDPDTAPEALEKLRKSAEAEIQHAARVLEFAAKLEAKLDRYTVEQYDEDDPNSEYVIIFTNYLGIRHQQHIGTLSKAEAEHRAAQLNR